ncbi:MAG: hypothetical protein RSB41_00435 [Bacilli bacterium]
MNVIIANKYKEMLMTLDIEVMKSMEGVFDSNLIVETFKNFYYERMILDITAIKDYKNISTLQNLSINLDASKIILVLDDSPESESSIYLSSLISMGFYNFTRNIEGIKYLIEHPNSYRDVAHIHKLGLEEQTSLPNNLNNNIEDSISSRVRIIGIKDLTEHSGSTTLSYLLNKHLMKKYTSCAVEVNKEDFVYFEDKSLISTTSNDLAACLMKNNTLDAIIIDLNDYKDESICNEIIYLIEPSILKLNKLVKRNRRVFENIENRRLVLNMSLLNDTDIKEFEKEINNELYFVLPPLNDRDEDNIDIDNLLVKLGFIKLGTNITTDKKENTKNKLFGLFKF